MSNPGKPLEGRSIFITGASTGIGLATALALAEHGATLWLAGRSEERHRDVVARAREMGVRATFLPLDLADLQSVRNCVDRFLAFDEPLHGLINNAGLCMRHGLTKDGFELAFGINHLGHFLLTESLLRRLRASAPSRIVHVASSTHHYVKTIDWDALRRPTRSRTGLPEYAVSKLSNILYTRALARRLEGSGVTTYAVHPGTVATDLIYGVVPRILRPLVRRVFLTPEQGAAPTVQCACSTDVAGETGLYYVRGRPSRCSPIAANEALALDLCRRSYDWTGVDSS